MPIGVAAWAGAAFGSRQLLRQERRAARSAAAGALTPLIRELRRLLRSHGLVRVSSEEVRDAFVALSEGLSKHDHLLPPGWEHLGRSVRDAGGTVFGAISFVDIRPDAAGNSLEPPDAMWQDYGAEYLEHVHRRLRRWGDGQRHSQDRLMTYDQWLEKTGRRDPVG